MGTCQSFSCVLSFSYLETPLLKKHCPYLKSREDNNFNPGGVEKFLNFGEQLKSQKLGNTCIAVFI